MALIRLTLNLQTLATSKKISFDFLIFTSNRNLTTFGRLFLQELSSSVRIYLYLCLIIRFVFLFLNLLRIQYSVFFHKLDSSDDYYDSWKKLPKRCNKPISEFFAANSNSWTEKLSQLKRLEIWLERRKQYWKKDWLFLTLKLEESVEKHGSLSEGGIRDISQ